MALCIQSGVVHVCAERNAHCKKIAVEGELWQRSIYKNKPNAVKFFSAFKTIFMAFLSTLLSILTTLLISLQKQEGALGQKKRHMVSTVRCAHVQLSIFLCTLGLATLVITLFPCKKTEEVESEL